MGSVIDQGSKILQGAGHMLGRATGFEGNDVNQFQVDQSAFQPSEQENGLTSELTARTRGEGPSVAEMQMKQGLGQAQGQAMGMAAAQRGTNPALAAHLAQQAQAGLAQQGVQQTGQLRAQEQIANSQLLQQALQSQRQGRMAGQQLGVQNTLGTEQIRNGAFDSQADRNSSFLNGISKSVGLSSLGGGGGGAAHGGVIPGYATGGVVDDSSTFMNSFASAVGQTLGEVMAAKPHKVVGFDMGTGGKDGGASSGPLSGILGKLGGGESSGLMAGGAGDSIAELGPAVALASNGGNVPGHPQVQGDSPKNDTVPTMLSPGEIVVPRTVASMGPEKIAQFVIALRGGR